MNNNIDDANLAVSSSAVTLESGSPTLTAVLSQGARTMGAIVYMTSGAEGCYWSEDGDDATTTDPILYPGDALKFVGRNYIEVLKRLSFIRVTSDCALDIKYYD